MSYRIRVALFFIACLVAFDVVVVYTFFREQFVENLALLLMTEGILVFSLGMMTIAGGGLIVHTTKRAVLLARPTLDEGSSQEYPRKEGILILIVGAVLIIAALLLLAFF